jgi:dihydroorotase
MSLALCMILHSGKDYTTLMSSVLGNLNYRILKSISNARAQFFDTNFFFNLLVQQYSDGHALPIHEVYRSHTTTQHSVGLFWTSDQPLAETSTWQHTTLATDIYVPGGIRTHNLSRWAAADLRLRPRGIWDRLATCLLMVKEFWR